MCLTFSHLCACISGLKPVIDFTAWGTPSRRQNCPQAANSAPAWISRSGAILQIFKRSCNGSLSARQASAAARRRVQPLLLIGRAARRCPVQDAGEFGAQFFGVHFILWERRRGRGDPPGRPYGTSRAA